MPTVTLYNSKHPLYSNWQKTYVLKDDYKLKRTLVKLNVDLPVPTREDELKRLLDRLVKSGNVNIEGGSRDYDFHDEHEASPLLKGWLAEALLPLEIEFNGVTYALCPIGIAVRKSLKDSNVEIKYSSPITAAAYPYGDNTVILNFHLVPGSSVAAADAVVKSSIKAFAAKAAAAVTFFEQVKLSNARAGHDLAGHGFKPRPQDIETRNTCLKANGIPHP